MMQVLETGSNQAGIPHRDRVLRVLRDIATQVQLQSNFCIRHPDYKPLELPEEAIAHFQRLPLELQTKFWRSRLQSFLYGIYYNGSLRKALAPDAATIGLEAQQNLENNTLQGVDLNFYEQLHQRNHGTGSFDPDWQVLRLEADGSVAVCKDGLTLYIERSQHLQPEHQSADVGDRVAILLPRNRVQNGFYLAVSNAQDSRDSETVRVYFNVSPEGAVAVMDAMTRQLNQREMPFRFKALYNPSDYERSDSAVLYIAKADYEAVHQEIQSIYLATHGYFRPEIPLFTKWLAPGLGLAEEPNHKFSAQESFGTNRCYLVALGLLEAWNNGEPSPESRLKAVMNQFSLLGVDLEASHLNAHSKDIYTPLALC